MWLTFIFSLFITVRIVLVFRFLNAPYWSPVLGVYQQKNKYYWFKFLILYIVLTVRQLLWRLRRFYAVDTGKSCYGTIHVHQEDAILEQKIDLGQHPYAIDATYFNGIAMDGTALEFSIARRQDNICDAWACIKVNGEEYLSPKMPDTYLKQESNELGDFKVEGIQIENFIPMRTWKLAYNGDMKLKSNPQKNVNVKAEFTWSALYSPFIYDYQSSPLGIASDMAREPWSRDYFKNLQKFHHTHYEQMGAIKGTVTINGEEHTVTMPCFRDRTFGKYRDWRNYHRCVYHTLYLDNGDCVHIGILSQPFIISHLTAGFFCRDSDKTVVAVHSTDLKLYQHGENKVPPKDYGFTFTAGLCEKYTVRVTVDEASVTYVGKQRDLKCFEQWLTVDVNGVAGRGLARWIYNNVQDKCE